MSEYIKKKKEDYRIIILPSERSKIGIGQLKDYGIISYLGRGEEEKIGELVLWALEQSDEKNRKQFRYKNWEDVFKCFILFKIYKNV